MPEQEKKNEVAVPVIEEELVTGRREVKTGSVRIRKRVQRIRKTVEMPVVRDAVKVERVPVNRVVKEIPAIREEQGMLVIPVVEEEIVVRRRLVLREEIHVIRSKVTERAAADVDVAREHAVVERLDEGGNVIKRSKPKEVPTAPPQNFFKEKGVL
jgi:uncharacterized protein (TIGR02271 family)